MSYYEALRILNSLREALSDNQNAFLDARMECSTDAEAFDRIGMDRNNKSRWLQEDPVFAEAYELVLDFPPVPADIADLVPVEDVDALSEAELRNGRTTHPDFRMCRSLRELGKPPSGPAEFLADCRRPCRDCEPSALVGRLLPVLPMPRKSVCMRRLS